MHNCKFLSLMESQNGSYKFSVCSHLYLPFFMKKDIDSQKHCEFYFPLSIFFTNAYKVSYYNLDT